MSLHSLTPSLPSLCDSYTSSRSGDRTRRQTSNGEEGSKPAVIPFEGQPEPAAARRSFAPILKTDLTGLTDIEPRDGGPSQEALASANGFLGAFSMLLASVASGDASAARDAATVLQLELFGEPTALAAMRETGEDAQARMLDDLLALIRFAGIGDIGSAEASAHLLARRLQTALLAPGPVERLNARKPKARGAGVREPASLVQGATAAYELLMDLDAGANAA